MTAEGLSIDTGSGDVIVTAAAVGDVEIDTGSGDVRISLTRDIERLGAHGYTITDARGKGHRGARSAGWEENGNIRIEVVCNETVADAVVSHLREHYYDDYAMILFVGVWVLADSVRKGTSKVKGKAVAEATGEAVASRH